MNEHDFIRSEIEKWGTEAIEDLLDKGFVPVLTNLGYRWLLQTSQTVKSVSYLDTELAIC